MPSIQELEQVLGYRFKDRSLLELALTHPSIAHEHGGNQDHNQRLEFLGDAVLQLAITAELYGKFPAFGEGPLTQARAQMVNRTTLASQAAKLDLGKYLVLSRGEESSGGRSRSSTISDAFEAVVGAVFLDGGYELARDLVGKLFRESFGELDELPNLENPKGQLQEFLQTTSPEPPQYETLSSAGPDHNRTFECAVFHGGAELARGVGRSKKLAESAAALGALHLLKSRSDQPAETSPAS